MEQTKNNQAVKTHNSSASSKKQSGRASTQQQDTGNLPMDSDRVKSVAEQIFEPVQPKNENVMIID
jgi:hypothetical protein